MTATATPPVAIEIGPGRLFIGGAWVGSASGETTITVNPATESPITTVARASAADAAAAATVAAAAFRESGWATMRRSERAKLLHRIADLIEENAAELAYRESIDMGFLYDEALHLVVPHIANMFRYYAGWTTKLDGSVRPAEPVPGFPAERLLTFTRREPLGVVAAITPFNFPLILSVSKIAPALAAGNCVVHKPASDTPLSALKLAEIIEAAGVPAGVYNTVTGPGNEVGNALVNSPHVDKLAFTGSTTVGRGLARAGADTLKHVTLELGGKSPNIVFADADLDHAAPLAYIACMWNKGEVCVAGSRLLVQEPIVEEMLARLKTLAEQAIVGDPLDSRTTVGPLASKAEFDKVVRYIEDAKAEGIPLVSGGGTRTVDGKGWFVEPTIFGPTDNARRIAREEIFGPVLTVIPFRTVEEAIEIANDTPYGLASGVQTSDYKTALQVAEQIKAGTVWLNTWHHYDPSAAFGGFKESGYGREHGPESLDAYTQVKTIWLELER